MNKCGDIPSKNHGSTLNARDGTGNDYGYLFELIHLHTNSDKEDLF